MATSTMNPSQFNQFSQQGMQPMMQGGFPTMQAPMQNMQSMPMQMGPSSFVQQGQQIPQPQILADNWNNAGGLNYNQPFGFAGGGMSQPFMQQPSLFSGSSDIQNLKEMSGSADEGHMKYCACDACQAKKTGATRYKSALETSSPQKTASKVAPTNVTCQNTYCVEVRAVKAKLDTANQDNEKAKNDLNLFIANLEALKLAATKAERKAENAMDNVTDLKDKHNKIGNVMDAGDQSRVALEQELSQGQRFAELAINEAADAATKVQVEGEKLSVYKFELVGTKSTASNAYSEWTVAACKAAAACNTCNWFDELNASLKDKCTYSCSKCGFKADFYDHDKHQTACSGDKSKIYHCSNGCGFCGEFEIVENHEVTTCPTRGRAPIAMAAAPSMYTSQTLPVNTSRVMSQPLYTSTPNINMQSMQHMPQTMQQPMPAQGRKEI